MSKRIWLRGAALALAVGASAPVFAETEIDFFFPVPVDGALAKNMSELVKGFNESQKGRQGDARLHRLLR